MLRRESSCAAGEGGAAGREAGGASVCEKREGGREGGREREREREREVRRETERQRDWRCAHARALVRMHMQELGACKPVVPCLFQWAPVPVGLGTHGAHVRMAGEREI